MIYEKRKIIKELHVTHQWLGIIPLALGILLYWLGELGGEYYTLYISLLFIIIGITMLHIGCERTKSLIFIFILIMAMFPFPDFIYYQALG